MCVKKSESHSFWKKRARASSSKRASQQYLCGDQREEERERMEGGREGGEEVEAVRVSREGLRLT